MRFDVRFEWREARARTGYLALAPRYPLTQPAPPPAPTLQSRCRRGGFFAFGCINPEPDLAVAAPGQEEVLAQRAAHDLHAVHHLRALVVVYAESGDMLRRWLSALTDEHAVVSAVGHASGTGSSREAIL